MKKILIFITALFVLLAYVSIAYSSELRLISPTNTTILNNQRVTYTISINHSNSTTYECTLNTNENGSSGLGVNNTPHETITILNDSSASFTDNTNVQELSGARYKWTVNCSADDDSDLQVTNITLGDGSISNLSLGDERNGTFGVDATAPVLRFLAATPLDRTWLTSPDLASNGNGTGIFIGFNVTDDNAEVCVIVTPINGTINVTDNNNSYNETFDYINITPFNFTNYDSDTDGNINTTLVDNASGDYYYTVTCNDTAKNTATIGNITFWIDTVFPTDILFNVTRFFTSPGLNDLANQSLSTDLTPQIQWNQTTELNFSRYTIGFYSDGNINNLFFEKNITDREVNSTNMTTLDRSETTGTINDSYYINIAAFDKAGNHVNITNIGMNYNTSDVCRELNTDWNICGVFDNERTLDKLLNESGGSTVAILNGTNEFVVHVTGGSNGDIILLSGNAVFMFINDSKVNWTDSVINITSFNTTSRIENKSNTDWNIVLAKDYNLGIVKMGDIDRDINSLTSADTGNLNITVMSFYNRSANLGNKYIPFVGNRTFNNESHVIFGDPIWMFLGNTTLIGTNFDWTDI